MWGRLLRVLHVGAGVAALCRVWGCQGLTRREAPCQGTSPQPAVPPGLCLLLVLLGRSLLLQQLLLLPKKQLLLLPVMVQQV